MTSHLFRGMVATASNGEGAGKDRQHHHRSERCDQQTVVEVGGADAGEVEDKAEIKVDDVNHRQKVIVRSGVIDVCKT